MKILLRKIQKTNTELLMEYKMNSWKILPRLSTRYSTFFCPFCNRESRDDMTIPPEVTTYCPRCRTSLNPGDCGRVWNAQSPWG